MNDTQADKVADRNFRASARRRDHKTALIFATLALVYPVRPTTRWSIETRSRHFVPHRPRLGQARDTRFRQIALLRQLTGSTLRRV